MFVLIDIAYFIALPFLLVFALISRLKGHPRRQDLAARLGIGESLPPSRNRILLHAVSVGEVNAIRSLVQDLQNSGYEVVVCVTTDTGLARADELFSESCHVTRFPFDFSFSMKRFLQRIKPNLVALVELEVWPNLIRTCHGNSIPILVINGRLSLRSFKRYKLVKVLLQSTFKKLSAIGMQSEVYASRVKQLGATRVSIEGTMKWDNAIIADSVEGSAELAESLGIDLTKALIVGGSTTPFEHELLKSATPSGAQLLCAPRRPEWFDDAEKTLSPCNRRTSSSRKDTEYFLLDTFGELDKAYSLADIVVIGRSFSPLHGSDPTASIALGKPTIIGPNVSDFQDMVQLLVKGKGIIQCSKEELASQISSLLEDKESRNSITNAGRKVISSLQGATKRYEDLIAEYMPSA
ncbi:MAG: hypothetical protein ISR75_05785 [Phycisphaerales bacterium]|nr:hypothetical protein [Planctomycetota bacterium]MBL6997930.1 hypothetical protein [Phycisphaerales bacterium]